MEYDEAVFSYRVRIGELAFGAKYDGTLPGAAKEVTHSPFTAGSPVRTPRRLQQRPPLLPIRSSSLSATKRSPPRNSIPTSKVCLNNSGPGARSLETSDGRSDRSRESAFEQAHKEGLDQEPATKSRIAFQIENLLAGAAYTDMLKKATSGRSSRQEVL